MHYSDRHLKVSVLAQLEAKHLRFVGDSYRKAEREHK